MAYSSHLPQDMPVSLTDLNTSCLGNFPDACQREFIRVKVNAKLCRLAALRIVNVDMFYPLFARKLCE